MIRFPLLLALVALAMPAAGRCESIDVASRLARRALVSDSAETFARAAVVVVRGTVGATAPESGDPDLEFRLALARLLTGLCQLDPRIRDAAAEDLLAPPPASF